MFYLDEEPKDDDNNVGDGGNVSEENSDFENGSSNEEVEQSTSNTGGMARKAIKDRVQSRLEKEGAQKVLTKMGSTKLMSLLAPILPYLGIIVLIILLIIVMIGIIMFLLMLPGVMIGQLKQFFESAAQKLNEIWNGAAEARVTDSDIVSVANYLENMGYDLRNYGFVTEPVTSATYDGYEGEAKNAFIDSNGIGRTAKEVTNINSEVLRTYLISDNYVYLCRNFTHNVKDAFSSITNFLSGLFGNRNNWGEGLIGIYKESQTGILWWKESISGDQGKDWRNSVLSSYKISVDPDAKKLDITTKSGFLWLGQSKTFTYQLDGWTARYGMPLEFLLAVHLTSMSPDLTMDLATAFDTEVVILLHESATEIVAGYKTSTGDFIESGTISGMSAKEVFENTSLTSPSSCTRGEINCSTAAKNGDLDSACDECEAFVKAIKSNLDKVDTGEFNTFVPYISRVKDHWFRDVYFVADANTEFVQNDEAYEEKTKERWTDYEAEKDEEGNVISYTLYRLNDDGSYGEKWNGTKEEADKQGIKVAKKPVTKTATELEEEGKLEDGTFDGNIWMAYEFGSTSGNWQQYSSQAQDGGEGADLDESVADNIYFKINTQDNVTQVQDAQRGVTNARIKQIFSTNKYYMYDGTKQRAELIEADRKKTENQRDDDNTENDARDPNLIGTFSVTRDSLTAFNILTNMNTFDSDSIYRDFKELIVELNYFDKEDLTAEPTDTWEWPIPETGSGGWPVRRFEKSEDVYGTLIDSKVNLDNLKESTKAKMDLKGSGKSNSEDGKASSTEDQNKKDNKKNDNKKNDDKKNDDTKKGKAQSYVEIEKSKDLQNITGTLGNSEISIKNQLEATGTLGAGTTGPTGSGSSEQFHKGSLIETATACWEYIVNDGGYSYAGASIPVTGGKTVDCSSYVSWVLYEYGYEDFKGGQHCTQDFYNTNWNEAYGWQEIAVAAGEDCSSQLQPGDLLVRDDGSNNGHIQFILSIEPDGTVMTYDCGASGHWVKENIKGYASTFSKTDSRPGKIIRIEDAQITGETYEGYAPYQDVVSPITGEIIEAGKTPIKNVQTGVEEEVGYIKIRALEKADLDSYFNTDQEGYEGYHYFYDEYDRAGVTGYILYIEGFDLRIVDKSLNLQTGDEAIWDDGEDNVRNSYTKNEYDDVLSPDIKAELEEKEKMREEALATVKTSDGKLFVKEGTVLGKTYTDGDTEDATESGSSGSSKDNSKQEDIPDDAVVRPGIKDIPEDKKTVKNQDGEDVPAPNGNYIRLILRSNEDGASATQNKDSIIENVEDYLEITDGEKKVEVDWEFYYWLPYESGGIGEKGVASHEGAGACGTVSGPSEVACGFAQWTSYGSSCNNIPELCKWLVEEDPSFCSALSAFTSYSSGDIAAHLSELQQAWWGVNQQDTDKFLELQMKYFYEVEYMGWIESDGLDWLTDKSLVAQGTYASLKNWGPNLGWKNVINQSMDDEAIIKALLSKAMTIGSSCGSLAPRWESQYVLGKDIITGAFTEVESWIRTKQPAKYGEGANVGALALLEYNMNNNKHIYADIRKLFRIGEA